MLERQKRIMDTVDNDETPPPKKKRGRPPKDKGKEDNGTDSGRVDATVQNQNCSAVIEIVDPPNDKLDTGIEAKCELTRAILDCFDDFRKDQKKVNGYSARCTICGDDESAERRQYLKGNNTNLKSHLKRVSYRAILVIDLDGIDDRRYLTLRIIKLCFVAVFLWKDA